MFRAFSRPSSGAHWLQWQPPVLPSYRGDSRVVFVVGPAGRPARPRTQHDYHYDTKVKPEAATAVIELLMMGGKTPETCWAVNKRQDNKLNVWGTRWRSWLRHCATSRKVAGSISDGIIGIFHWHNPSSRSMALGLTQPLSEMSTRNISWGVNAAGA